MRRLIVGSLVDKIDVFNGFTAGDGGYTNYSSFESDGTLVFNGAATVYKDINIGSINLGMGASAPDLVAYNGTSIVMRAFDGNVTTEQLYGSTELQHDYKEGTDIVAHIHWCPTDTGTGNVIWYMDYVILENSVASAVTPISVTVPASGVAWKETRADIDTISGAGLKIGAQIAFRLYRVPTGSDTYAGDAMVFTIGFHYQIDTIGSRGITDK